MLKSYMELTVTKLCTKLLQIRPKWNHLINCRYEYPSEFPLSYVIQEEESKSSSQCTTFQLFKGVAWGLTYVNRVYPSYPAGESLTGW